jgi:hypothetical protein
MTEYEIQQACERQKALWDSQYSEPIVGEKWDPWNVMRVPWSWYNHYKTCALAMSDKDIKEHLENILKCPNYEETVKIKEYRKHLDNAVWYL